MQRKENVTRVVARAWVADVSECSQELVEGCGLVERSVVIKLVDFGRDTYDSGANLKHARFSVEKRREKRKMIKGGRAKKSEMEEVARECDDGHLVHQMIRCGA